MIEHEVDKTYRALNGVRNAARHAVDIRHTLEAKRLQDRFECMAASFTALLLDTLKAAGFDARSYAQSYKHVYVKVESHPIEVWFNDQPQYSIRFSSTDTMYGVLRSLLPRYRDGIYTSSIVEVIDALREIDTTLRTYEQCTTCHYSSVGAMGHGNHYYCGAGAVPTLPQCSQYRHYPMQALLSWVE